jgi:molybdate transport system substrate-binding protein
MRLLSTVAALVAFAIASPQAAEIRVLCSNGVRAVVERLESDFERTSGHTLAVEFSSTATLSGRIEKGETFDVVLLTSDAIEALIKSGKLAPATRTDLARTGIGVGIRKGAPKPDIRTPAAVKAALQGASSLAYTRDGASRAQIDQMLATLGIAAEIRKKTTLTGPAQAPEMVARGEAGMVITLISEILPIAGLDLVGPLPMDFQRYVTFAAATSPASAQSAAARAFIAYLDGPAAAPAYTANGMETK